MQSELEPDIAPMVGIHGVAKVFGCGLSKAWEVIRIDGFPKGLRVGRSIRWPLDELVTYRDRLRETGTAIPSGPKHPDAPCANAQEAA